MANVGTGNNVANDDFLRVLLALKDNTMRSLNVAEVCQVTSISDNKFYCKVITTEQQIICYHSIPNINVDDIVLVIFTNTDFRINLRRLMNDQQPKIVEEDKTLHTKDNGIVLALIYRPNNGGNL